MNTSSFKYKLPYYLWCFSGSISLLVFIAGLFNKEIFIGLVAMGIYVSPLIILALIINKFLTWEQRNKYFYLALILNSVLAAFAFYSVSNIF